MYEIFSKFSAQRNISVHTAHVSEIPLWNQSYWNEFKCLHNKNYIAILQDLPRKTRLTYTQVSKADQRFYYDTFFLDGLLSVREAESNA